MKCMFLVVEKFIKFGNYPWPRNGKSAAEVMNFKVVQYALFVGLEE